MGKAVTKINKTEKQILCEVDELNNITKNKLFEKRSGMLIDFNFDKRSKKIGCRMV